jgi:flagellin
MRVRGNWISLFSWRAFSGAARQVDRSIAHLSSGKRIDSAADDAAGLGIAQRIQGQFRGLIQANRNALDGISLVQTAEGALNQIQDLLQRGRELSVYAANGVLSDSDKGQLQTEVDNLITEIDHIAGSTEFNGNYLLTASPQSQAISRVLTGLRTGWLQQSEALVQNVYGLVGDGTTIQIALDQQGTQAAWVTGTPDVASGKLDNLVLHINLSDFSSVTGPIESDRHVARAFVEAVLGRNTDMNQVAQWFQSGVADYLAGGDEQLKSALQSVGGNAQQIVDVMNDALSGTWKDDSIHRAAAYLTVKYLDNGLLPGLTMKDVLDYLKSNTLEDTINWAFGSASLSGFLVNFLDAGATGGAAFLSTQLNLNDADVGAVGGGDNGTVIPDGQPYTLTPLSGFKVLWPPAIQKQNITLQVGANAGDTLTFEISEVTAYSLDLLGLEVVKHASEAIDRFHAAMQAVTGVRSSLGAIQNRLEHTINANALTSESEQSGFSRITDLDVAREVTNLTREQIMVSSSSAMLAQANTMRQNVNWLLKGLGTTVPGMAFGTP